jgi:hypothetical protein
MDVYAEKFVSALRRPIMGRNVNVFLPDGLRHNYFCDFFLYFFIKHNKI